MKGLWATALLVFRNGSRKKIFWALLGFGMVLFTLTFALSDITFSNKERVILDSGKSLMLLFSIFYILFLGSSWIHEDSQEGSIELILSKPISREAYLMGKFLGDTLLLGVLLLFMTLALELTLIAYGKVYSLLPLYIGFSILLESSILLSLTFLLALITSPFLAFISGLTVFMAGSSLELLSRLVEKAPFGFRLFLKPLAILWPDFSLFEIDHHLLLKSAPHFLFIFLSIYTLGYFAFFLGGASLIFRRMDL